MLNGILPRWYNVSITVAPSLLGVSFGQECELLSIFCQQSDSTELLGAFGGLALLVVVTMFRIGHAALLLDELHGFLLFPGHCIRLVGVSGEHLVFHFANTGIRNGACGEYNTTYETSMGKPTNCFASSSRVVVFGPTPSPIFPANTSLVFGREIFDCEAGMIWTALCNLDKDFLSELLVSNTAHDMFMATGRWR